MSTLELFVFSFFSFSSTVYSVLKLWKLFNSKLEISEGKEIRFKLNRMKAKMCFQIQKIREWGSLFSNSGVRENKNVCFQDQKTHQIFLVLIAGYEFGLVPVGGLSGGCLVDLHRIRVEEFARFLPRSGLQVFCELQQSILLIFPRWKIHFFVFLTTFLTSSGVSQSYGSVGFVPVRFITLSSAS